VVVYGSNEFISVASVRVQVSEEMSNILAPETPVTTTSNTVGSNYPTVAPPPYCVTVDMKKTRHLSNSEHWAHLILM
jgi:hypothetical protein